MNRWCNISVFAIAFQGASQPDAWAVHHVCVLTITCSRLRSTSLTRNRSSSISRNPLPSVFPQLGLPRKAAPHHLVHISPRARDGHTDAILRAIIQVAADSHGVDGLNRRTPTGLVQLLLPIAEDDLRHVWEGQSGGSTWKTGFGHGLGFTSCAPPTQTSSHRSPNHPIRNYLTIKCLSINIPSIMLQPPPTHLSHSQCDSAQTHC